MGKLNISFGGLIAFNLADLQKKDPEERQIQALLVSGDMPHLPRLTFDPEDVDLGASTVKVGSILQPDGKVAGYVDLTGLTVSFEGGTGGEPKCREGKRTRCRPEKKCHFEDQEPGPNNKDDFDWVPRMSLIVKNPTLDEKHTKDPMSETTLVASRVVLKKGEISADERSHKRDNSLWNIINELGKTYEQYVADFVTLLMTTSGQVKIKFSDSPGRVPPDPTWLAFKPKSSPNIAITCFPKDGQSLNAKGHRHALHFAQYFKLLTPPHPCLKVPHEIRPPQVESVTMLGVYPVKCMPTRVP